MTKKYRIELDALSRSFALNLVTCHPSLMNGLEIRAGAWEKTAEYLRTKKMPEEEFFVIEECNGQDEAEQIAEHYRSIIETIRRQMEQQNAER